jgi:branched-chain amino acid transport system substrate-binding protein
MRPPARLQEEGMKRLRLFGLALGVSVGLTGAALAQDITIGVAGPMTGGEASFGRQMRNGAEQAVADINARQGVLGKKLKLEVGDDACDPKQARSVAEKFAGMKVPLVAGHYCSSSSIPASEAYAEGNVLQITPASTNPQFTERNLWNTFRVCGRDDQQGAVAGAYIARQFKGKNIAIIHDKTTYGKGLADETKKALNGAGTKEKLYEAYNKGDKDFTALVSKLKRDNVDLVYVGGYHQEAGLILRQMRDQGLKTVLMAGDALADKEFASITGPAGEGVLFTFGPDPRKKATAQAIVDKFKAKNIDPEGYTLYSYAAIQVWAQAAAKAGSTDPKKVAATMKQGDWDTVLGKLSFTPKGDITVLDYVVYKWDAKGNYAELEGGRGS